MAKESLNLNGLKVAFEGWRKTKRYKREAIPKELVRRARELAAIHGVSEVLEATGQGCYPHLRKIKTERHVKGFREAMRPIRISRMKIPVFQGPTLPLAEVETPQGFRVKIFSLTPEMVDLMTSVVEPWLGGGK